MRTKQPQHSTGAECLIQGRFVNLELPQPRWANVEIVRGPSERSQDIEDDQAEEVHSNVLAVCHEKPILVSSRRLKTILYETAQPTMVSRSTAGISVIAP
jgi:hypothetical protein